MASFVEGIDSLNLLVNNAGGAKGFAPLEQIPDEDWEWMYQANVLGRDHVFNGDQDRASIIIERLADYGSRPKHGWSKVNSGASVKRPPPSRRDGRKETRSGKEMSLREADEVPNKSPK